MSLLDHDSSLLSSWAAIFYALYVITQHNMVPTKKNRSNLWNLNHSPYSQVPTRYTLWCEFNFFSKTFFLKTWQTKELDFWGKGNNRGREICRGRGKDRGRRFLWEGEEKRRHRDERELEEFVNTEAREVRERWDLERDKNCWNGDFNLNLENFFDSLDPMVRNHLNERWRCMCILCGGFSMWMNNITHI